MSTPIIRVSGTNLTASPGTISSGSYGGTALRVQQSALSPAGLLLGDFRLTGGTWGGNPAANSCLQLFAVDRDASGNAGSTPGINYTPRLVGNFTPYQVSSSFGVLSLNNVALSPDADYYVYNNATGQSFSGSTLTCMPWSPGT